MRGTLEKGGQGTPHLVGWSSQRRHFLYCESQRLSSSFLPKFQQMEQYAWCHSTNPLPPPNSGLYFLKGMYIKLDFHYIQQNKFQIDFANPESNVKINKNLKMKMRS